MSNIKYDLAKLSEFDEFDSINAVNNFSSEQDYFDKLTYFTEMWHDCLRLYNPTMVVFSDEVRENFFTEMNVVENIITQLKMTVIASKINDLKEAINNKSDKALSDNLRMFSAALEIASNHIVSARTQDSDGSPSDAGFADEAKSNAEKPVILAVDDSSAVLTVISDILESKYKVIVVTSGKDAIDAINKYSPDFFLLDIEMPIMNGIELAKIIKNEEKFKDTPIIFLTGQASRDYVVAAKELGVSGYMLKPIDKTILLDRIEGYFSKK